MKKLIPVIFLALLSGCGLKEKEITDVSTKQTVTLTSESNTPTNYKLRFSGFIDGVADVSMLLEGGVYRKERIMDHVAVEWSGDWYNQDLVVVYEPIGSVTGELKIEYSF